MNTSLKKTLIKVATLVKIKTSNFLENSEIPLESMPKNVLSWISPKEQNIGSFKIMFIFKLEIQHGGS